MLGGGENQKKYDYLMTCENYMTFKYQCPQITFYWDTATLNVLSVAALILQ